MFKNMKKKSVFILMLCLIFCVMAGALASYVVIKYDLFQPNETSSAPSDTTTETTAAVTGEPSDSDHASSDAIQLEDNGSAIDGTVITKSQEEMQKELDDAQLLVTDKITPYIQFPGGQCGTVGSWLIENVESNIVTMQCELFVDGDSVAKTVPIRPGQYIDTVTLSKELASDTYDATASIYYFDLDTGTYISQANYQVCVTIQ